VSLNIRIKEITTLKIGGSAMRYFIDDTPKIKLKYASKDWIKILIFIAIFFSPELHIELPFLIYIRFTLPS
jgi:hypothetical protein